MLKYLTKTTKTTKSQIEYIARNGEENRITRYTE